MQSLDLELFDNFKIDLITNPPTWPMRVAVRPVREKMTGCYSGSITRVGICKHAEAHFACNLDDLSFSVGIVSQGSVLEWSKGYGLARSLVFEDMNFRPVFFVNLIPVVDLKNGDTLNVSTISMHGSQESTYMQTDTEEKQEVYAKLYKNIATRCGTVYRKQACLLGGEPLYHYDIYLSPEVAGIDSDEVEVYFDGTRNLDYWLANFSERLRVVK